LRAVDDPDLPATTSDSDAWGGLPPSPSSSNSPSPSSKPKLQTSHPPLDHEEQYLSEDSDKYTTVTVEAVAVTKDGLRKLAAAPSDCDSDSDGEDRGKKKKVPGEKGEGGDENDGGKKKWPKKPRKQKFRYESKVERKASRMKQKSRNKASADARKGGG
jgi:ribosomal RNA-processing protein 17